MNIREQIECREQEMLSPFASLSIHTRGREREEPQCNIRPVYQRDRDRILHSKSFRRLKHKTQVFLAPQGDHYRTRLTHTLEVAQIARTIAKALRLNEELTEAIALGHDLGHTPFGHAGESALNEVCSEGFSHYRQSVRVVAYIEKRGRGLNLTWETLDGIVNHRTSGSPATLEGGVVRLSDKIAYINHDIDDAIRAGILADEEIPDEYRTVLGSTTRERLDTLVQDLILSSEGQPDIRMSAEVERAMIGLRKFMFDQVYSNPRAKGEEAKAKELLQYLFRYYHDRPELLPEEYLTAMAENQEKTERFVCDYIAGMTDQYAIETFREIYLPRAWK